MSAAADHLDPALAGAVAIVTGAGSRDRGIGNGRAAALLLAAEGARVLCVDRQPDPVAHTVELIEADGGTARAIEADVTDPVDCERVVATALEWGPPQVLVNNVGVGSRGSVVDETIDSWDRIMRINVTSMVTMAGATIPTMTEGGSIINISSISALRPRGLTAYSTSKGAVIALTQAMAVDHGADGIRVNCVAPGPVYTPMVSTGGMSPEARQQRVRATILGIEGSGWDVGNAVAFLASDRARWITGQTLVVDGGVTLKGPTRSTGTDGDER
ncbi:MAG: SDR family oxidoreductase [Actinomycetia bacterium]|nr:SDR family oxidoreductase [Actinomycetes bacterium]